MKFEELKMSGTGSYDIGITVEPMPHSRGSRFDDDGYRDGITLLARIKGGTLSGVSKNDSYEVNMYAPQGVEDFDGDSIVLASFEFHSFQLDTAHNGILRFKGFLSAAEAYPQAAYDSMLGLSTTEEFEKISAITKSTGQLRYMPPKWEEAQQFLGYKAHLTMRPYSPEDK